MTQNSTERLSDELLPCPFCGGTKIKFILSGDERVYGCADCGCVGPQCLPSGDKPYGPETVTAWNSRSHREAETGVAVAWQWSDFSGKWYTIDTARLTAEEQETMARAIAEAHEGRVRPLFAAPQREAEGVKRRLTDWFNALPCESIGKEHFDALKTIVLASPQRETEGALSVSEAQAAYALLWRMHTTDKAIHAARRALLTLIGKEGQRAALQWAIDTFGPVEESSREETDTENMLRDMKEGRFPERSPKQMVPHTAPRETEGREITEEMRKALKAARPIVERAIATEIGGTKWERLSVTALNLIDVALAGGQ
jgi:hypothetical protein